MSFATNERFGRKTILNVNLESLYLAQWVILHQFCSFFEQFSETQKSEKCQEKVVKEPKMAEKGLKKFQKNA